MSITWLTKGELKSEVKQIVHEESGDLDELIDGFIRDAHRYLEDYMTWEWLLVPSAKIQMVEGQEAYTLPEDFHKMHYGETFNDGQYIFIDGNVKIWYLTEWEFKRKFFYTLDAKGLPRNFRLGELVGVRAQPINPSLLTIHSTSALDTDQIVQIKGKDVNGNEIYEQLTLNGQVEIKTANEYSYISFFSIYDSGNGNVYCTSNNNTITNIILNPGERTKMFELIKLNPIPDSTAAGKFVTFWYQKRIPDLINDNDVSIIPNPIYLKSYVRMRIYEFQNDGNGLAAASQMMQQALGQLVQNQDKRRFLNQAKIQRRQVRFL